MEVIPEKWPAILTILPETKGTERSSAAWGSEFSGQWGPRPVFLSSPYLPKLSGHTAGPIAGSGRRRMIFPRRSNCSAGKESGPPKI